MFDESSCIEIYCVHICGRDNHGNKTYVYIYIHSDKERENEIATHPPPTINQPAIDGQPVFCDNYFGGWTRAKITVLYAAACAARCIMKTANALV